MIDAKEYGRALFLITEECGTTERTYAEVEAISSLLSRNPEYTRLLDTPAVAAEEKCAIIEEAFGSFDINLVNLVKLLSDKHLIFRFADVHNEYGRLYDESRGIERVVAVSAVALSDAQLSSLKAALAKKTGKRIIITNEIDPSLLGGMKLRYLGMQLDGSVKARLDSFAKGLKNLTI